MSNPWIQRVGPLTWPYGPGGASGDNVTAMPNNVTLGLGYVQLVDAGGHPLNDLILPPWRIVTGPTVSGTGIIQRWLVIGETPSLFTGGLDPTSPDDQTAALEAYFASNPPARNAMLFETLVIPYPATAYYFLERYMRSILGNLPFYLGFLLQNLSGGPLSVTTTDNIVTYSLDQ